VGLSAQGLNSKIKTIIRVFDADLGAKLQDKLSVSKILSVSSIAAPYFVSAVLADKVSMATRWRNHLIILSENTGQLEDLGGVQTPGIAQPLRIGAERLGARQERVQ